MPQKKGVKKSQKECNKPTPTKNGKKRAFVHFFNSVMAF
jgi:hypothetical protein